MEEFTSINWYARQALSSGAEMYWGTWIDVTDDILHNPAPRGSAGIRNNKLMDRFADGGEITVAFKNNDGAYSELDANELPYNVAALRMTCTWDGVEKIKFEGFIKPGSMKFNWDDLNNPYVQITYQDFITWCTGSFVLDNIEYQTSMDIKQAVIYLLNQIDNSILMSQYFAINNPGLFDTVTMNPRYQCFETGVYTFPDVFDMQGKSTTVGGEFRKLAESELGYIYQSYERKENAFSSWGNCLVIENREHRRFSPYGNGAYDVLPVYSGDHDGDTPLLSDGSSLPLLSDGTSTPLLADSASITITMEDLQVGGQNDFIHDAHHMNMLRVKTRPRKVDAAATTVLWTMETSTLVEAGGTVTGLRGRFRDPDGGASYVNCIELTTPVASTDYEAFANADGTGANLTASLIVTAKLFPSEVEITLENIGATDLYTGKDVLFQIRGRGVYQYDTTDVVVDLRNPSSNFAPDVFYPVVGISEYVIDLYYLSDASDILGALNYKVYWDNYPRLTCNSIELLANTDTKNMRLWMYGDIGTNFRLDVASNAIDYDHAVYINGYSFTVINNKYIKWQIVPIENERMIAIFSE